MTPNLYGNNSSYKHVFLIRYCSLPNNGCFFAPPVLLPPVYIMYIFYTAGVIIPVYRLHLIFIIFFRFLYYYFNFDIIVLYNYIIMYALINFTFNFKIIELNKW